MSSALDYMRELLPDQISLEEKCKRYTVLLAMAAVTGIPYQSSVIDIAKLDHLQLDEHYRGIDVDRLSSLYMRATERYRTTRLTPTFIEIIECLEKIDTPSVKKYLGTRELKIIVDLYMQVLGQPDVSINLDDLDLANLHPTFLTTLHNLFNGYLDVDRLLGTTQIRPFRHYKNREWIDPENIVGPSSSSPHDSRERKEEIKRKRRVLRQQRYRERNLIRQREQARLTQRRLATLDPEQKRERDRLNQQRKRESKGQGEPRTISKTSKLTPEEKRQQRLQRRRDKRKRERLERLLQRQQQQEVEWRSSLEQLRAERGPYLPSDISQTEQQLKRKQFYSPLMAGLQQCPPRPQPQPEKQQQQEPASFGPPIEVSAPVCQTPLSTGQTPHMQAQSKPETPLPNFLPLTRSSYSPYPESTSTGIDQVTYSAQSRNTIYDSAEGSRSTYNYITDQMRDDHTQFDLMHAFYPSERTGDDQKTHKDLEDATQSDDTDTIMQWLSEPPVDRTASTASSGSPPTD